MPWYERDYNREVGGRAGGGGTFGGISGRLGAAPVTKWLIIINFLVFLFTNILTGSSRGDSFSPADWGTFSVAKAIYGLELWRWITYQFLHADFFHFFFNMIVLFFFGPMMESWWGNRRFVAFYLLCGMSGALVYTLLVFVPGLLVSGAQTPMLGASGSIYGVLIGCAVLYPHQRVMLLFPPIPMSMRTLALVMLGFVSFSIIVGSRNAGGDAAHLGGAVLGFILIKNARLLNFADRRGPGHMQTYHQKRSRRRTQRERAQSSREEAEVNRILDKVREKGMHSLSSREKKILERATDRQRRAS